jgi:hypothetical protein
LCHDCEVTGPQRCIDLGGQAISRSTQRLS